MNEFNLIEVIDDISIKNSLEKEVAIATLKNTLVEALSEILNLEEEEVVVEVEGDGVFKLYSLKEVLAEKEDNFSIVLEEAKKFDPEAKIGDMIKVPLSIDEIGRQNIQIINRGIHSSLLNIQKSATFQEMEQKLGTIVTGLILRKQGKDVYVDLGKIEAKLPIYEQSPRDQYNVGSKIKVYIKEVFMDARNRLNVIVSRAEGGFVKKLLEMEVPEMQEGIVKVKSVVRSVGKKTKMAVYATKHGIEPVGTCVGFAGVRIKGIIKEINGEKIDIIPYSENFKTFLTRSLQPAQIKKIVIIDSEKKEAVAIVDDENYPLAVGKSGSNINLACQLTGWRVTLKTISQIEKHPDILEAFNRVENLMDVTDEDLHELTGVSEEVLVKLMAAGINSISDLYEKSKQELVHIDGITEKDAMEIRRVLEEMVEMVDDIDESQKQEIMGELEDNISGVDTDEEIIDEVEQVEYLICPYCNFEFEYSGQTKCPSCGTEFEFEEE